MNKELNFYIIVTDAENIEKIHGIIKRVCEWWSHYIDNMWMVATSMPRDDLTELIWEKGRHLIVASCDMVKGYLTPNGWNWLDSTNKAIELSKMENPSLTDMFNLGYFDNVLKEVWTIKDIDILLAGYEDKSRSSFELDNVRGRMISYLQNKIKDNL